MGYENTRGARRYSAVRRPPALKRSAPSWPAARQPVTTHHYCAVYVAASPVGEGGLQRAVLLRRSRRRRCCRPGAVRGSLGEWGMLLAVGRDELGTARRKCWRVAAAAAGGSGQWQLSGPSAFVAGSWDGHYPESVGWFGEKRRLMLGCVLLLERPRPPPVLLNHPSHTQYTHSHTYTLGHTTDRTLTSTKTHHKYRSPAPGRHVDCHPTATTERSLHRATRVRVAWPAGLIRRPSRSLATPRQHKHHSSPIYPDCPPPLDICHCQQRNIQNALKHIALDVANPLHRLRITNQHVPPPQRTLSIKPRQLLLTPRLGLRIPQLADPVPGLVLHLRRRAVRPRRLRRRHHGRHPVGALPGLRALAAEAVRPAGARAAAAAGPGAAVRTAAEDGEEDASAEDASDE